MLLLVAIEDEFGVDVTEYKASKVNIITIYNKEVSRLESLEEQDDEVLGNTYEEDAWGAIIILSLGALSNKNIWLKTKYKSVKVIADGHIIYNWENQ